MKCLSWPLRSPEPEVKVSGFLLLGLTWTYVFVVAAAEVSPSTKNQVRQVYLFVLGKSLDSKVWNTSSAFSL